MHAFFCFMTRRFFQFFHLKMQLHISPFPFPSPSMKGVNIFEHKIFVDVYYRTKLPHVSFFVFFCFVDVPHRQSLKGGRDRSMYCTYIYWIAMFHKTFFFGIWRDRGLQSYASVTQRGNQAVGTFLWSQPHPGNFKALMVGLGGRLWWAIHAGRTVRVHKNIFPSCNAAPTTATATSIPP